MVIIDYKAGQLANRLFHFSYFIAHAAEHKYTLVHPLFDEYKDLFETTTSGKFAAGNIRMGLGNHTLIGKAYRKTFSIFRKLANKKTGRFLFAEFHNIRQQFDQLHKEFDMADPAFIKKAKNKLLFAKGWNYRDEGALKKHADTIRKIFAPKEEFIQQVQQVKNATANYDVRVGVHIRKGDYKNFFDGRWFYTDEVYAEKMNAVKAMFLQQGKACVFIVCSNEPVQHASFNSLPVVTGERHPVVDLFALASCDYLMGPPSTFTMWASFYGQVPLWIIKNKEMVPAMQNFKITNGVEAFF
jgi:hypothetical protein